MEKKTITLTESKLRQLIGESVRQALQEGNIDFDPHDMGGFGDMSAPITDTEAIEQVIREICGKLKNAPLSLLKKINGVLSKTRPQKAVSRSF